MKVSIGLLLMAMSIQVFAQKENSNTEPYPFGNPVIKHMYTADASPHVMPDGRVWMVTSVDLDEGGGYSTMHSYHTFSSADMRNWTDHGEVFSIEDIAPNENPKVDDYALWAPDMVYRNGKYYLYYPVHIRHRQDLQDNGRPKVTTYIAVAVSNSPDQKFTVLKDKIEGTRGIDPSIFVDDDDEVYLYWGSHWVAKLKDNMFELATEPVKLEYGEKNFMEAPWMHKRKGKYYFNYHTKYGKPVSKENPDNIDREKSRLDYSWGDSPMGPLSYGGILNYELGYGVNEGPKYMDYDYVPWRLTQSNHGGVVTYHGKDYLFYHTSALSSWRQDCFVEEGTWTQRSVCVDEIRYNEDGSVRPVQQTVSGVVPVKVDQPFEIKVDLTKAEISGAKLKGQELSITKNATTIKLKDVDFGSGYYYFDLTHQVKEGVKVSIRLDDVQSGYTVGTIILSELENTTMLREAEGKHDVYITIEGAKKETLSDLRFFAGAPQKL
ncbi:family 43 glycosylhydrolase [Reichenbachiella ulvae]|uniref:Family 43 glycosylhydrolase n=1 Tax=Reichenbachiella ulvae TaxID=2980104 RepID=A0ABT3D026_9BACT|nr:family 43 glycosylhydrolase [Reichenbachiella ulvae]MCV9389301.1 family 43 glycosylhydrolase [Reichenbachiella ulvae]